MHYKFYFFFLLLLTVSGVTMAQTTEEEEAAAREDLDYYKGESRQDRDNNGGGIWYGAGALLNFSGGNGQSFFQIGISPMAGYKFNNFLSVGPRVSLAYNSFRFRDFNGQVEKNNFITWTAGMFARAKIYRGFFAHAEYSLVSNKNFVNGNLERATRALPFLGAGLSQGGGPGATGFEILILFRLTQPELINDSPYEFRTGINYNF